MFYRLYLEENKNANKVLQKKSWIELALVLSIRCEESNKQID